MLAWKRGLGVSHFEGIVSPAYSVFRFRQFASPKFMHYLLRTDAYVDHFKSRSTGVIDSRLRLYPDTFSDIKILVPPTTEQTKIAAFLDHETAMIDGLIAKQERLIALLEEKRQAVISHAVTKGLDPTAPLRPSGIDWLGEVPVHWEVKRVKTVSTFMTSGPRGWSEKIGEDGAIFVQSGDLNELMEVEFAKAKRVLVANDAETARTQLYDGDVVVCITGAKTGNVAVGTTAPDVAFINQHLALVRPAKNIEAMFLGFLLKSKGGQAYFEVTQYGLKQGLSLTDVNEAPVVLPPLSEQTAIIEYLIRAAKQFVTLNVKAQSAITLLKERRTALISAAVTGKIDLRDWQQPEGAQPHSTQDINQPEDALT